MKSRLTFARRLAPLLMLLLFVSVAGIAETRNDSKQRSTVLLAADDRVVPKPKKCREVCRTEPNCGPVTFVRRCVDGNCFDFPRQHCSPQRVCSTVCD